MTQGEPNVIVPPPARESLFRRVLRNMAFRIAIVSLLLSAASYYYSYSRLQDEALSNLAKYLEARSQLESDLFLQAETNVRIVRDEFQRRHALLADSNPDPEFRRLLAQDREGTWRVRVELDDFERKATVAILPEAAITPEFQRQVLLGYELLSQYGPGFRNRYYDTFIDLNGSDASLMFLPDLNYARNGSAADFREELEAERLGMPEHNPARRTLWTGIYFDRQALQWMVSVVTPIDDTGRFIGAVGQDVLLDQLIERTNTVNIPGTWNFIMTRDGLLIAHPEHMDQIKASSGRYQLAQSRDPFLQGILATVQHAPAGAHFVETADGKYWLGMVPIRGANWQFITVYPKILLQKQAAISASLVLLLGLFALLVEVGLLAAVLRRDVVRPLRALQDAIRGLAQGRRVPETLAGERNDELGEVTRNFRSMASVLGQHRQHLEAEVKQRTAELAEGNLALQEANAALQQLNAEKNELLAVAAHDLKNPVGSMLGMAQMLERKLDEWPRDKVQDRLRGIATLGARVLNILGNLLDHHALETGNVRLQPEPVALERVLADLLGSWQERLDSKRQQCQCTAGGLTVLADRQALWQILENLLSNAVKYAPQDSLIRIEASQHGAEVEIAVIDQGPGVAAHEMPLLFRKFSRLSAVPTGGERATGLGLAIVKRLAEAQGGSVRCESQLGHGARFLVRLPLALEGYVAEA
ncbi:HAMP domain-containing histidine kinase [Chitinilyticum litopenaei]|uniref:HAMP domain-containing histidine kinase n=1 Tax=Chitinilyticum litopenaei TaxID=1121276 RepID=UPI000418B3C6|nr:HAMP domain-containing histidine kinase [Chitinilyticum litopenaei]